MVSLNLFRRPPFATFLQRNPIAYLDVGARGGFESDLLPLAFATDAIGLEPNPTEFARLQTESAGVWKSVRFLPTALSGASGRRTLHVPADAVGASLLPPDKDVTDELRRPQFFKILQTLEVDTLSLDAAARDFGLGAIDYLKLDVEGAELEILNAGRTVLDGVSAVKTEVSFLPFREGQGTAVEIIDLMTAEGFRFIDLIGEARWRRDGHIIHPHMGDGFMPYSRGALMHCDFLFFRLPAGADGDPARLIKSALLAMCFGFYDHALAIFERPDVAGRLRLDDPTEPLQALARLSRRHGRLAARRAFRQRLRGFGPFLRRAANLVLP